MHEPTPVDRGAGPVERVRTGRRNYWQTPPAELVEWARPAGSTQAQASRRRAAARRASRRTLLRRQRTTPARS
jgi:hypothetical protein